MSRTPPVTRGRTPLKKELRTPNSKLFGEYDIYIYNVYIHYIIYTLCYYILYYVIIYYTLFIY